MPTGKSKTPGEEVAEASVLPSLTCPISYQLFADPVVGEDGHSYERSAIEAWLAASRTSPLTREPMSPRNLRSNITLRNVAQEWRAANPRSAKLLKPTTNRSPGTRTQPEAPGGRPDSNSSAFARSDPGSESEEAAAIAVWSDRDPAMIQADMRRHAASERVQEKALIALRLAAQEGPSRTLQAVRLCLLQDLQSAMRNHLESPGVQYAACEAWTAMAAVSPEAREAGRSLGIMADVQVAMQRHSDSPAILGSCLLAVQGLAEARRGSQSSSSAQNLAMIPIIQQAMQNHIDVHDLQAQASVAVSRLTRATPGCCARAVELQVMKDIQAAMQRHPQDVLLQGAACGALRNILCVAPSPVAVVQAGDLALLEDLQAAMRCHSTLASVQEEACAAIRSITFGSPANKQQASKLGLLSDCQAAMRMHRQSAAVQLQAIGAIANICCNNSLSADMGALCLLEDVAAALRQHSTSLAVRQQARCAVVNIIVDAPDNEAKATRLGLVDLLAHTAEPQV